MKYLSIGPLLVAGLIHLLPVSGVVGVPALSRLYGIVISDTNSVILLQHRALLFGMLGVLMLIAIPVPMLRITALTIGLFSSTSFILVAIWVGTYNDAIGRVVAADMLVAILLAIGLVTEIIRSIAVTS